MRTVYKHDAEGESEKSHALEFKRQTCAGNLEWRKPLGIIFLQKNAKDTGFIFPSEKWQHQQHFAVMQWFSLDFQSRVISKWPDIVSLP